jgi:hypothetical protein
MEHMRPRIGSILLGALFALLCAADAWQLGQAARGRHPDPPSLLVTHGITGVLAGLAALGIVRDRRWATIAVLGWGAVTAGMLVALGPALNTPPEERPQLWVGAAVVGAFTCAIAWYLRRSSQAIR